MVLGHRRWSSDFAPAVALVFLLLLVVIFVLGRVVSSVQLVLMIVMVERALVALHQVAWNILRRCVTQRRVSQVHEEGALVDDLCTWKENQNRRFSESVTLQVAKLQALQKHMGRGEWTRHSRRSKNNFFLLLNHRLTRTILLSRSYVALLAMFDPIFTHPCIMKLLLNIFFSLLRADGELFW